MTKGDEKLQKPRSFPILLVLVFVLDLSFLYFEIEEKEQEDDSGPRGIC